MDINDQAQAGYLPAISFNQILGESDSLIEGAGLTVEGQVALTGTCTSLLTAITGVGTAFLTEINVGDLIYLVDSPTESRRVLAVTDDENLIIDTGFTTEFSAKACNRANTTQWLQAVINLAQPKIPAENSAGGLIRLNSVTPLKDIDVTYLEARSYNNTVDLKIAGRTMSVDTSADFAMGLAFQGKAFILPTMAAASQGNFAITANFTPGGGSQLWYANDYSVGTILGTGLQHTGSEEVVLYDALGFWHNKVRLVAEDGTNYITGLSVSVSDDDITYTPLTTISGLTTDSNEIDVVVRGSKYVKYHSLDFSLVGSEFSIRSMEPFSTNMYVWADDNGGTQRFIFDDYVGSNLIDAEKGFIAGRFSMAGTDIFPFVATKNAGGGILYNTADVEIVSSATAGFTEYDVPTPLGVRPLYLGYTTGDVLQHTSTSIKANGIENFLGGTISTNTPYKGRLDSPVDFIPNLTGKIEYKSASSSVKLLARGYIDERVRHA